jgi:dTMP kinase
MKQRSLKEIIIVHKGYFISIEGGEGAGKSTAIQKIVDYLHSKQVKVITTREPGGIQIAEQIRAVVLNKKNVEMDSRTEALLYAAARRQHMVEKIIPALNEGKIVICDRFVDSSLAYQGHARGLGIDEVLQINEFAIDQYMPDLTILMDVDPEIGLARIHADSQREVNRLDLEAKAFHHKVREGYQLLLRRFPHRMVQINAAFSEQEVADQLIQLLKEKLEIS